MGKQGSDDVLERKACAKAQGWEPWLVQQVWLGVAGCVDGMRLQGPGSCRHMRIRGCPECTVGDQREAGKGRDKIGSVSNSQMEEDLPTEDRLGGLGRCEGLWSPESQCGLVAACKLTRMPVMPGGPGGPSSPFSPSWPFSPCSPSGPGSPLSPWVGRAEGGGGGERAREETLVTRPTKAPNLRLHVEAPSQQPWDHPQLPELPKG